MPWMIFLSPVIDFENIPMALCIVCMKFVLFCIFCSCRSVAIIGSLYGVPDALTSVLDSVFISVDGF